MVKDKQYYIEQFKKNPLVVQPGQNFVVRPYQPDDALKIAQLYHAVYGETYYVDYYYIPEELHRLNCDHTLYSVVCQSADGNIIAHGVILRHEKPSKRLYEIGRFLVLDSYRKQGIASLINRCFKEEIVPVLVADAVYGEPVTNHTGTQHFEDGKQFIDFALELNLVAARGQAKRENRLSCLMQFDVLTTEEQELYIPDCYKEEIDFLVKRLPRHFTIASDTLISNLTTLYDMEDLFQLKTTGTVRITFSLIGADFNEAVSSIEEEVVSKGYSNMQAFLNLSEKSIGAAVDILRKRGWILGGYLPCWFGKDGLLMQKPLTPPQFDTIQLYSQRAKDLLRMIRSDYYRADRAK